MSGADDFPHKKMQSTSTVNGTFAGRQAVAAIGRASRVSNQADDASDKQD